uniref:Uncharacterized protein n=1 Tax=Cacopsylla melanoneura TaxID=428564 RepID=A0A8D8PXE2_9HEMI
MFILLYQNRYVMILMMPTDLEVYLGNIFQFPSQKLEGLFSFPNFVKFFGLLFLSFFLLNFRIFHCFCCLYLLSPLFLLGMFNATTSSHNASYNSMLTTDS